MRNYGREDVNFETWYSSWMKQLAKSYTVEELEDKIYGAKREAKRATTSHLRAIERSSSMQSNSQARAQSGNCARAAGDLRMALEAALEIHELFPEHAKKSS